MKSEIWMQFGLNLDAYSRTMTLHKRYGVRGQTNNNRRGMMKIRIASLFQLFVLVLHFSYTLNGFGRDIIKTRSI